MSELLIKLKFNDICIYTLGVRTVEEGLDNIPTSKSVSFSND